MSTRYQSLIEEKIAELSEEDQRLLSGIDISDIISTSRVGRKNTEAIKSSNMAIGQHFDEGSRFFKIMSKSFEQMGKSFHKIEDCAHREIIYFGIIYSYTQ